MGSRLQNKVAIVTGASRGIGRAIAKLYAQEGARLLVAYERDDNSAQETLREIRASGGAASLFKGDVSTQSACERMADDALRLYGRIDILCSNAAIYPSAKIEEITEESWDRVQAVNLKGAFLCVKACLPHMKAQGYGKIVVTSSITGVRTGISDEAAYGASKGGIMGFILCACLELAQHNVTINAVLPGWVLTEGVKAEMGDERLALLAKEIPMRRLADPLDVAYGALFFSTDESRYITGQALTIDGGLVVPELPVAIS